MKIVKVREVRYTEYRDVEDTRIFECQSCYEEFQGLEGTIMDTNMSDNAEAIIDHDIVFSPCCDTMAEPKEEDDNNCEASRAAETVPGETIPKQ